MCDTHWETTITINIRLAAALASTQISRAFNREPDESLPGLWGLILRVVVQELQVWFTAPCTSVILLLNI